MIDAKIICDSLEPRGNRLTTFVLVFPRFILAEFNTHRMFTRNSASSRAIPIKRMLSMVIDNPFIPIKWMKDHSGMQGTEYFTDEDKIHFEIGDYVEEEPSIKVLEYNWLQARDEAVRYAKKLNEYNLTKQMCNRLLEPFLWHTVLLTATEFENFFSLRADKNAEIHIQDLAEKMLVEYNNSEPKILNEGEWHIPFGDKMEGARLELLSHKLMMETLESKEKIDEYINKLKVKIATARCARISYNNFEGKDDYEADIDLHDRLLSSGHFSPFEHCAKAMNPFEFHNHFLTQNHITQFGVCGNFRGFIQYRKMLENENRKDKRVIKK